MRDVDRMGVEELRNEVEHLREVRAALSSVLTREHQGRVRSRLVADEFEREADLAQGRLSALNMVVAELGPWGEFELIDDDWASLAADGSAHVEADQLLQVFDILNRAVALVDAFEDGEPLSCQGRHGSRSDLGSLVSPQHLAGCPADAGNTAWVHEVEYRPDGFRNVFASREGAERAVRELDLEGWTTSGDLWTCPGGRKAVKFARVVLHP